MIFDLFHSISDPVVNGKSNGPVASVAHFLDQAVLAESLGMDTVWCAESHFSSEVQKETSVATIPNFFGEVGLNCDSFQLFHLLASRTKRIHLGTGIHNIVGGSGGPIASADRVNMLRFMNESFWPEPRNLRIGVAAGRFPYQNTPFGMVPRNDEEKASWSSIRRTAFLEALEIFLRLLRGEALASSDVSRHGHAPRWEFERLKLAPEPGKGSSLQIVLGSADPEALALAQRFWDVDLFNLSFTPPEQIEQLHAKMAATSPRWHRSRLPRTVLVFVDPDRAKARALAERVLDTYVEAMRGTAQVPDKAVLLQRALVGDAAEVREQLSPENPRRFHPDDRLMLWFEFNQLDNDAVKRQMRYFFDEVAGRL